MLISASLLSLLAGLLLALALRTSISLSFHRVVYYCSSLTHIFSFPIPSSVNTIFLFMLGLLSILSLFQFIKFCISTIRIQNLLKRPLKFPKNIYQVLKRHNLETYTVLVANKMPLAFCFGIRKPKIYFSTGLLSRLNEEELEAVLLHEDCHRQSHHPLSRLLLNLAKIFLPIFPLIGNFISRQIISEEINADISVVAKTKNSFVLLTSLEKLLTTRSVLSTFPAFATYETLKARISLLQGEQYDSSISYSGVGLSVASFILLLSLAITPVHAATIGKNSVCLQNSCMFSCKKMPNNVPSFSLPASFVYSNVL